MPGYLVAVVVILALLPDAKADLTVWLANLSLTQIYVPLTLTAGLTQMWSLSVEVASTWRCRCWRCWRDGCRCVPGFR